MKMYSCHDISDRIGAHFDGELSLRERIQFRLHLAICVHCRRFIRQFAATIGLVRLRAAAEPDDLQAQLDSIRRLLERRDNP